MGKNKTPETVLNHKTYFFRVKFFKIGKNNRIIEKRFIFVM
jgi:hypothetical protein